MSKIPNSNNMHWNVLVVLTEKLQIPEKKHELAVEKYEEVGELLEKAESPLFSNCYIYPQGSVRLGTTVKPYKKDEYDIDLVVHLPHVNAQVPSEEVKEAIGNRLREQYEKYLEPLKRGWRINFPGDFYLDITPAIPDNNCNSECPINKEYAEHVPDSKLITWKASNPRGFADWFIDIDKKIPVFANDTKSLFAMESRNVEQVPSQDEFKGILKRAVQLMKRHRDIYFNETHKEYKDWKPISILISTLAARAYEDLIKQNKIFTPIELIKAVISNMPNYIQNSDGKAYVANPTNKKENFADKWEESSLYRDTFNLWIEAVHKDIEKILNAKGIDNIGKVINDSFGTQYSKAVVESMNQEVASSRDAGALASGVFNIAAGAPVIKNTFFGS